MTKATLTAMPRARWKPELGISFAIVGTHILCGHMRAATDAADAAELARRWNEHDKLRAALMRLIAAERAPRAEWTAALDQARQALGEPDKKRKTTTAYAA
jgi:hypothetical protein